MTHEVLEKARLICDEKVQTSGNLWGWEWGGGGLERGKRGILGVMVMFWVLIDCACCLQSIRRYPTIKI